MLDFLKEWWKNSEWNQKDEWALLSGGLWFSHRFNLDSYFKITKDIDVFVPREVSPGAVQYIDSQGFWSINRPPIPFPGRPHIGVNIISVEKSPLEVLQSFDIPALSSGVDLVSGTFYETEDFKKFLDCPLLTGRDTNPKTLSRLFYLHRHTGFKVSLPVTWIDDPVHNKEFEFNDWFSETYLNLPLQPEPM